LPYKPLPDRQVIVERGRIYEKQPNPKNVIIEYENPHVNIDRHVYDEGVLRADPRTYSSMESYRNNAELRIVDRINDLPMPNSDSYQTRSYTPAPTYYTSIRPSTPKLARPKTASGSLVINPPKGPTSYVGPWNTTYRSSYTGRKSTYY
jgi:hypothetical protein